MTNFKSSSLADKVVWITGASSGIGEEMAYLFAREGATLILSSRREAELERVKGQCPDPQKVHVAPLDLMDMDNCEALVAKWVQELGRIDILVNNGGISMRARVDEAEMEVHRKVMEVNFFGQVALTRAVLPYMLVQGFGQMVAISSLVGKFGFPLRSSYAASKHALHGFFETLHLENKARGVQVTIANPGRIATNISLNALNPDGTPQGTMDQTLAEGMDAKVCARQIVSAIKKRKYEITVGTFGQKFLVMVKRLSNGLFHFIASKVPAQ